MREAVIVSTARTPLTKSHRGEFNITPGPTLAAFAVQAAVERSGLDPALIEDLVMGTGYPEGTTGRNIGRQGALRDDLGFLVGHGHRGRAGHDLVGVDAGLLRGLGAALALGREAVLRLAADAVARGHDVGGLDHGHVQGGLVLDQPGVQAGVAGIGGAARADLRDAFDTASDQRRRAVGHDLAGSAGNGLQSRGAEAADGLAGHRKRQAGADRDLAADVAAGRAFGIAGAHDDVLEHLGVHARALDGGLDGERRQRGAGRDVEFAAVRLGQRRAGGGNDDGFAHG